MEFQEMAKDVLIFTKVAKFHQIWSHWYQRVFDENI